MPRTMPPVMPQHTLATWRVAALIGRISIINGSLPILLRRLFKANYRFFLLHYKSSKTICRFFLLYNKLSKFNCRLLQIICRLSKTTCRLLILYCSSNIIQTNFLNTVRRLYAGTLTNNQTMIAWLTYQVFYPLP